MPGGDRTGPEGRGAMSGRGAGYCAGKEKSGREGPGFGPVRRSEFRFGPDTMGGFGRRRRRASGRGLGRGFRFWCRDSDE